MNFVDTSANEMDN